MRISVALVALVALSGGCKSDHDFPVIVGGGAPGGGGMGVDAGAPDGGDAGPTITGLVCLLPDPRALDACATTGVGGLTVTLDGVMVTTADDGSFVMPLPSSSTLVWQVQGTSIIPSLMTFSALPIIPAINIDVYHNLQLSNGDLDVMTEGAIMARVIQAGAPLAGATGVASPAPADDVAYDSTSATTWNHNFTGANGTVWIAGLASGSPTTVTITPPQAGTPVVVSGLTVGDEAITFLTIDVP